MEDNLKHYLATDLRVVNHQKQADLPDPLGSAEAWGLSLSTHDFYRQLAKSLESSGSIELPKIRLRARHNLSWRDATWLVFQHDQFGTVVVLQRNFAVRVQGPRQPTASFIPAKLLTAA